VLTEIYFIKLYIVSFKFKVYKVHAYQQAAKAIHIMNIRSKSILEAAIKEFIKTGEPVSSKELGKKYKFGVKDATIRNELNALTKEGFLAQLHTSGGRVPTDRGYKFFVEETAEDVIASKEIISGHCNTLLSGLYKGHLRDFVEAFSDETCLLGVGRKEKEVYKSGLDSLFERLDLETKDEINEIIHDFEKLDERMHEMSRRLLSELKEPRVFIGDQSPITKSRNLSVIIDSYLVGDFKVLIAIVGPKRMDYDKNLKLFKSLHRIIIK